MACAGEPIVSDALGAKGRSLASHGVLDPRLDFRLMRILDAGGRRWERRGAAGCVGLIPKTAAKPSRNQQNPTGQADEASSPNLLSCPSPQRLLRFSRRLSAL